MTYREHLHKICTETDLDDKEEVTRLISYLLQEAVDNNTVQHKLEDKLMEVMSAKDFHEFTESVAKEMAKEWIRNLPDSDLKTFAEHNMDIIMDDSLGMDEAMAKIREREESHE